MQKVLFATLTFSTVVVNYCEMSQIDNNWPQKVFPGEKLGREFKFGLNNVSLWTPGDPGGSVSFLKCYLESPSKAF